MKDFYILENKFYIGVYYEESAYMKLTKDPLKADRYDSLEKAKEALDAAPHWTIRKVHVEIT